MGRAFAWDILLLCPEARAPFTSTSPACRCKVSVRAARARPEPDGRLLLRISAGSKIPPCCFGATSDSIQVIAQSQDNNTTEHIVQLHWRFIQATEVTLFAHPLMYNSYRYPADYLSREFHRDECLHPCVSLVALMICSCLQRPVRMIRKDEDRPMRVTAKPGAHLPARKHIC